MVFTFAQQNVLQRLTVQWKLGRIFNIFQKLNTIYAPTLIAFKIYTKLYVKTKCSYLVFKAGPQGLFTKLYFITFKYMKSDK